MANIFNDSSEPIRESGNTPNATFTNLTVENLIAENIAVDNLNVDNSLITTGIQITGIANHSILTAGVSGVINGLLPGLNKDVLISNGLDALWTNSLELQNLKTNTLNIPTTLTGDILVFDSSSNAQKLSVGTSGQFLISDGINPTWNDLPNPLILGGLQVNGNSQFSLFNNRTLITDNSGFIVSETIQLKDGSSTINTTPSQPYGTVSWYFTQNSWYSIKVQVNNFTANSYTGEVLLNATLIGKINSNNNNTFYCEFTYNHLGTSGFNAVVLNNFVTTSGTSNISFSIRAERFPTPSLVA